ncbi:hypothetical protein H0H92_015938 [Tricholoma furcatifolium]|nr:hypothetical protein H0H92_015938 [Tricholoma furcatifolium]
MSLSRSRKTSYYTIPQPSHPQVTISSHVCTGSEDEEAARDCIAFTELPAPSDSLLTTLQFRWIHFILGCGALIPWTVLTTAIPYFLSQLNGSAFREDFTSYLMVTMTVSVLVSLAYATITAKQTSHSQRVRRALVWLSFSCLLLTFCTFISLTGGAFFVFILVTGAIQTALVSDMLVSVVAVASLFGPQAMQSMMSGQAAIAVIVNGMQVSLSSAIFLWRDVPDNIAANTAEQAEKDSARIFFVLSTLFLILCAFAHSLLVSEATYKALVIPLLQKDIPGTGSTAEDQLLIFWEELRGREWDRVLRIAKANITFELLRPSSELPITTPFINSDMLFMVILFIFGLSNGYLSTVCMMAAPSLEHNPRLKGGQDDVDMAATLANFSIAGGLAISSAASFVVRTGIFKYP